MRPVRRRANPTRSNRRRRGLPVIRCRGRINSRRIEIKFQSLLFFIDLFRETIYIITIENIGVLAWIIINLNSVSLRLRKS